MPGKTSIERSNVNRKRSVMVSNKRTSVSLEDTFWNGLRAIVKMENTTIENYLAKISRRRDTPNFSSDIRIAVLQYYQRLAYQLMVSNKSPPRER